ncbi:hypothetical protein TIFTF001_019449 [Ficus carica]|uniref:RING-type domain-containing protein n=1 Tax=Ficus carica TaxID=3494 RepID=A0AA88AWY6_FICCA|nr:hypothetical protein TIFTF001_019449 [Ficus carica]
MSTQSHRVGVRGYRRRKVGLNLDLNCAPPGDNRDQEGTSTQARTQDLQSRQQDNSAPPATIDVEAIDDDVIESSPRAFAAAKNKRRNRGRTVVDVESDLTHTLCVAPSLSVSLILAEERNRVAHGNHKRRRTASNQTIINCDLYINLESGGSSMLLFNLFYNFKLDPRRPPSDGSYTLLVAYSRTPLANSPTAENAKKPPPPPKEPTFTCPICMGQLAEEMSTKCGHIFCKTCIKAAISAQECFRVERSKSKELVFPVSRVEFPYLAV